MTTYIYQHPDWPNFNWDVLLLTKLLAEAHDSRGRLIGRMEALDFTVQQETILSSLTLDAVKSSEIEGEHLDLTQVCYSVARRLGIALKEAIRSSRHVDGVVAMILDATPKWAKIAKCSHDTALRDIHRLINPGILMQDERGGRSTSYSLKKSFL